jgi:hypothetical protein
LTIRSNIPYKEITNIMPHQPSADAPRSTVSPSAPSTNPLVFESLSDLYELHRESRERDDHKQAEIDSLTERLTYLEEKFACLSTLTPIHHNLHPQPKPAKPTGPKQIVAKQQIAAGPNGTSATWKKAGPLTPTNPQGRK